MAEAQKKGDASTTTAAAPAEEKAKTPITVIEEDDEFEVPLSLSWFLGGGWVGEWMRARREGGSQREREGPGAGDDSGQARKLF